MAFAINRVTNTSNGSSGNKTVDKAILKAAYILSTISGVEKPENKKVFKKIAENFEWFKPGDSATDKFVLEIIEATKDLATLKQLYDEKDYFEAFLGKLREECETIRKDSNASVRKAFVIWVAICLADNDEISEIENKALQALQSFLNYGDFTEKGIGAIGYILGGMIEGIASEALNNRKKTPAKQIISDNFLQEAISTITTLGQLSMQIEACSDDAQKQHLQDSYDLMQDELKSMILND